MKLLRLLCACTLLLLAAVPTFAFPCEACPDWLNCESTPGSGTTCMFHIDYCETISAPGCRNLTTAAEQPVLADWTVASIEVTRPDQGTKVISTPAAIAQAEAPAADLQK